MREAVEKDSQGLVESLAQEYQSRHRDELKQKVAQITQHFIDRGLFNTTACVGDQLQAEVLYIEGLVDHVLASLEPKVSQISLMTCTQTLLQITENEYGRIISGIGGKLIACNLAGTEIISGFQRDLGNRRGKIIRQIEVRFEAWERQEALRKKARERWYQSRTIQAAILSASVALFLAAVGWLIAGRNVAGIDGRSLSSTEDKERTYEMDSSHTFPAEPNTRSKMDSRSTQVVRTGGRFEPTPPRNEMMFRSEDTDANVNRPAQEPVLRIRDKTLSAEEPNAEVITPEQKELMKKRQPPIKPAAS